MINKPLRWGALLCASAAATTFAQEVVETFDDHTVLGTQKATSSVPGLTLSTVTDAPVAGTGALSLAFDFIADETWGGAVDVRGPGTGFDFTGYTGLSLRYKAVTPVEPTNDVTFIFKLVDQSTLGTDNPQVEFWEIRAPQVLTDASGEWQELLLPFESFEIPSWVGARGDETLNLDQITNWEFQVIVEGEGVGDTYAGEIHFDNLTLYGPVDAVVITNLGAAATVEAWTGFPLIYGNANPSLAVEGGAGANAAVSGVIGQSFQPTVSFTLDGISIVGQAGGAEGTTGGTYSLVIHDLGAGDPLNEGSYTANPIVTVGFVTEGPDAEPSIYHFDFGGLSESVMLQAGNNYVLEISQESGEEFFWAHLNEANSLYENGTLFEGGAMLESGSRDSAFAIFGTREAVNPVTEWGFEAEASAGFTITESAEGDVTLTAEVPGVDSGSGDLRLRGSFEPITLAVGDTLTFYGSFTVSTSVEDASVSLGGAETRIGIFNDEDTGGDLVDVIWNGTQDGYSGYLLAVPTGTAFGELAWSSGTGVLGAFADTKADAWFSTGAGVLGSIALGGTAQIPEGAEAGAGTYDFEFTLSRVGENEIQVDYHVTNGEDYTLAGSVTDTGINEDGGVSATTFNSVGFRFAESHFTDLTLENVSVVHTEGPPPQLTPEERLALAETFYGVANTEGYIDTGVMGWVWAESYPWIYCYDQETWLYVHGTVFAEMAWFYNNNAQEWWFSTATVYPWVYVAGDAWVNLAAE